MPKTTLSSCGWRTVTVDTLITTRPCILHGAVLLCSAVGGDVSLYEGQDADSGRLIVTLKGATTVSLPVSWVPGLLLERGLYVDVGSSFTQLQLSITELGAQDT